MPGLTITLETEEEIYVLQEALLVYAGTRTPWESLEHPNVSGEQIKKWTAQAEIANHILQKVSV